MSNTDILEKNVMVEDKPKKRICLSCGGVLVLIGRDRKKGKQTHGDWDDRKYHKKCLNK